MADDDPGERGSSVPWPDAPWWVKAIVILTATGVWAYTAALDAQNGRKPEWGTLIVFILVMLALFGREVVKAVKR